MSVDSDQSVAARAGILCNLSQRCSALWAELEDIQVRVEAHMTAQLQRFVRLGDAVEKGQGEQTCGVRITKGNGRGATRFEIASPPRVLLRPGRSFAEATWIAKAHALNADGKRMSGRTHSTGQDNLVTIEAPLFAFVDGLSDGLSGDEYRQFCDQYVNHWMKSDPQTYKPLRQPAAK